MEKKKVQISWLQPDRNHNLSLPKYHSDLAAGMDVEAALEQSYSLEPGETHLFSTGLQVAIPAGYEIQARPRSAPAAKHGVTVINSPGTIDADYRGEIRVALINLGQKSYTVERGDRRAQLILAPVVQAQLELVKELEETTRGSGGFGHTGV